MFSTWTEADPETVPRPGSALLVTKLVATSGVASRTPTLVEIDCVIRRKL